MPDTPSDSPMDEANNAQTAADFIRGKVARLYDDEPAAAREAAEAQAVQHRSKHQQFMYDLSSSGKDLAAIQTEWHDYYQNLPDDEKHQVWQEFYDSQSQAIHAEPLPNPAGDAQKLAEHKHQVIRSEPPKPASPIIPVAPAMPAEPLKLPKPTGPGPRLRDARSSAEIRDSLREKVSAGGKLQARHHLQSLLFGLGMGVVVVIIFLFGFFNEVFIAPFIQPSRVAAATPLIVTANSVAPTTTPEVIIPKINVEIPVDYNETSTDENTIENDLENGVVHYPTTVLPGQDGNTAFFGHSSNNIFNKGKYKFAFVLLHTLVVGDTFYLTYNSKVYVYKVISRSIVDPSDVGVLGPVPGQTATATLITCDPPGTSLHRLIVVGQQISPDPTGDVQAAATTTSTGSTPTELPGNGPTLWTRFTNTVAGKASLVLAAVIVFILVMRWVNDPKSPRRAKL